MTPVDADPSGHGGSPFVRIVVLNYNGGEYTPRCLEHLRSLDWPKDRLQVMVVDNASTDGSPQTIRERFPEATLVDAGGNLGFAGGNNIGLRNLSGIDLVALLNNDAFVEPGWLRPLVDTLEADPGLGAVNSKIVFSYAFIDVSLETEAFSPGGGDSRTLGVMVSGVRVDGQDRFRKTQFIEGFYGQEPAGPDGSAFQWSGANATIRIPVEPGDVDSTCELRIAAEKNKTVTITCGQESATFEVGPTPTWVKVALTASPYDVINNVGSELVTKGYGADRGFLERDNGQYEQGSEIFAWCGCSVLFRKAYLDDVGIFDERLFLYYEDFDLSWRGRRRGWSYAYVPGSVVRHIHTATSIEDSPVFQHFVHRNRMLVLVKNAPASLALQAFAAYVATTARLVVRQTAIPILRGRRPAGRASLRRIVALASFLRHLPWALKERLRIRLSQKTTAKQLMGWLVQR